jgi:hypothetical protein
MSFRIALIGEGKNDYGIEGWDGRWVPGAAQSLIRLFFPESEIVPLRPNKQLRTPLGPGRNIPKLRGQANNLRHFIPAIAPQGAFDLFIYYQDLDKKHSGKATDHLAKRSFQELLSDLDEGFRFLHQAYAVQGIAMIPMRMLENWLLGDEMAFEKAFGSKPANPRLPSKPEFIWGDEQDRKSDHPKNYIQRVLAQFREDATTENFILIADSSDVETMKRTCENSFKPFAEKMEQFAATLH